MSMVGGIDGGSELTGVTRSSPSFLCSDTEFQVFHWFSTEFIALDPEAYLNKVQFQMIEILISIIVIESERVATSMLQLQTYFKLIIFYKVASDSYFLTTTTVAN